MTQAAAVERACSAQLAGDGLAQRKRFTLHWQCGAMPVAVGVQARRVAGRARGSIEVHEFGIASRPHCGRDGCYQD